MVSSRPIVVAGLTPAWQQIAVLPRLRAGEVNRATEVHWCASGKVVNVGLALHRLGGAATTLTVAGGATGQALAAELQAAGAQVAITATAAPTRVCTTILEQSTGVVTELVENAAPLRAEELAQFQAEYQQHAAHAALVIHTGSLPQGTPVEYYAELLCGRSTPALLDVRGPELLAALATRPLLVKPNREELAHTLGRTLPEEPDVWNAADELCQRGAKWVLVTSGRQASCLAGPRGRWQVATPTVETVNPIGCGDCLLAGVAARLAEAAKNLAQPTDDEMLAALRWGIAAAALNAQSLLPARLERSSVSALAGAVSIERVA